LAEFNHFCILSIVHVEAELEGNQSMGFRVNIVSVLSMRSSRSHMCDGGHCRRLHNTDTRPAGVLVLRTGCRTESEYDRFHGTRVGAMSNPALPRREEAPAETRGGTLSFKG